VLLVPVGVDGLTEVALAVEQPDADERECHVAGRLHVVAREDAEAARIDAERFVDPVLGAEVGDLAVDLVAVLALEPMTRAVGHVPVEGGEDVLVFREELLVLEESAPIRRAADDRDRVAVPVPGRPVDQAPEVPRARVPRPMEVVREASQALEPRRQWERCGRDGRDGDEVHGGASYRVGSPREPV
jgi:hypothetical protein